MEHRSPPPHLPAPRVIVKVLYEVRGRAQRASLSLSLSLSRSLLRQPLFSIPILTVAAGIVISHPHSFNSTILPDLCPSVQHKVGRRLDYSLTPYQRKSSTVFFHLLVTSPHSLFTPFAPATCPSFFLTATPDRSTLLARLKSLAQLLDPSPSPAHYHV